LTQPHARPLLDGLVAGAGTVWNLDEENGSASTVYCSKTTAGK